MKNRCKDIVNNYIDWSQVDNTDTDSAISQLRSLHTEGIISTREYDYILRNFDKLVEEVR